MKHIDRETIEKYVNGDLGVLRRIIVKRHLNNCTACTRLTAEIKKGDELVDSLRKARDIYMGFEKDSVSGAVFANLETRLGVSRMKKSKSV